MISLSDDEQKTLRAFIEAVEAETGLWAEVVAAMAEAGVENPDTAFLALRAKVFS